MEISPERLQAPACDRLPHRRHQSLEEGDVVPAQQHLAENLVGPLNGGWGVANGSLGHERTMMWLGFADRLANMIGDVRPRTELQRDQYASMIIDYHALRAMGSVALGRAARGEMDTASVSVLKLFGSEAEMRATDSALTAAGAFVVAGATTSTGAGAGSATTGSGGSTALVATPPPPPPPPPPPDPVAATGQTGVVFGYGGDTQTS